jgi:aerobic C4-dicarboxylate transport protein
MKKPFYKVLYVQVLAAIVIGVLLGFFFPDIGASMKPLGDGFIKLIKMLIAPVIFCTVVIGIAGMEDMKKVGKVGGIALLYFEIVTTLALLVGLFLVNVLQPGAGMHVDPATLDVNSVSMYATAEKPQSTLDFIFHIIPSSVVGAFAQGDILQVLFFSIIFGFALQFLGGSQHPIYELIKKGSEMINWIMKVAPIGAFGAMAFTIGKYGIHSLLPLGKLMLVFYATCVFFVLGILGAICRFNGFSIFRYLAYIKEELLIVLGTSSSEAVLPQMITKMQKAGVSRSVTGLVIPTGYSFNLDGTAIYLTMAAVFIAQACDIQMTFTQQATLLTVLLLTSKGAAGVSGSGFIVLAATLSAVGDIPVAGLALILGVDRFMSEARSITNMIGNGIACVVVGRWVGELDKEQLKETLSKKKTEPDLLEEIEEKIENEIEEVLAPQPALVPIPVSESASEPREVR